MGSGAEKKADYRLVIKLAGDALAKRSKDIRLAEWLVEAQFKMEGFPVLLPGIALIHSLQETFWPTLHPQMEEDGDLQLRALAVEAATRQLAVAVRRAPLTQSGLSLDDYLESRHIGYEKDATTEAKQEIRRDAIATGKLCAEDFDRDFEATPKSFYVDANDILEQALAATGLLDEFQQEKYGDAAPNLTRLRTSLEEVYQLAASLLNERRKTEPDPLPVVEAPAGEGAAVGGESQPAAGEGPSTLDGLSPSAAVSQLGEAYLQVVRSAEFFFESNPVSPVAYLVCTGLRFGETRMQGPVPAPGFAVGPAPEMRRSLRTLAGRGAWRELLRASIPILASECSRAWLDLHRYIWRAGQETGANAISSAVVGTVRSLLEERPELRHWILEDDTGAANPETQQWIDTTVLHVG